MSNQHAQGGRCRAFLIAGERWSAAVRGKTNFGEGQSILETEKKDETY